MMYRIYILFVAIVLCATNVWSQVDSVLLRGGIKERMALRIQQGDSIRRVVKGRVDSVIDSRQKISTDTNFVARPTKGWMLRVKSDGVDNFIHLRTDNSDAGKTDYIISSPFKTTVGFAANYRGFSASFSLNPAKILGKYSETDYDINYYNNRFGFDLSYSRVRSLRGRSKLLDRSDEMRLSSSRLRQTSVSGYYVFNGRKFSYPSVFNNTWIQRRSAGSLLATMTYYDARLTTSGEVPVVSCDGHLLDNVKLRYFSVGIGYGYNFVPSKHWLIHLSAQPGWIVWKTSKMSYQSFENEDVPSHRMPFNLFNVCVTGRVGLSYSWNKYFIGFNSVLQHYKAGSDSSLSVLNTRWKSRVYFGLRL